MTMDKITSGFGLIAVLGGVARMLMTPGALIWGSDSMPELWAGLIACYLMAIGSIGIYMYEAVRTGVLGFIGCLLLSLGNMMTGCLVWSTILKAEPSEAALFLPIVNNALMLIGLVLFSFVTFRAGQLPRWAAVMLLIWVFLGFIPALSSWLTLLWGLAYVGLGYPVWRNNPHH
ncbi:hypothetical protein ACFQI7_32920 [Paenibacillus allorhizosphaerae]|uniref:Uncharacterized protein n=1 Tax=Paenibacillus allorhizosphaerae TaxID=2849866 RepID=A0ABM8VRB4_9BACL|nr:hypothetical protein [Paenibacillus allorhizosphaerae]CAG7655033.1 hypothetical protein PAECIP111802_05987 [Paenibacillus allorhizosphaerae]